MLLSMVCITNTNKSQKKNIQKDKCEIQPTAVNIIYHPILAIYHPNPVDYSRTHAVDHKTLEHKVSIFLLIKRESLRLNERTSYSKSAG